MKKTLISLSALFVSLSLSADICIKNGDTVAFMGDSITQQGNNSDVGYVNLVMKGLEFAGVKANKLPAGISGNKSNSMLARLEKDVLSKKPQWMTFSCGVNDVWHGRTGVKLEQYKENVTKIFDMCASNGVKVIVLTATMIGEDANNDNNQKLAAYNEWLRDEAKRRNLRIADLNADMQSTLAEIRKTDKTQGNKLTRDGVHMAYKGNVMMAWGVLRAMGLEESMKKAVLSEFDNIPGAYNVAIKLSAKEYSDLVSKLKCDDKKLQEYVREKLLK